MSKPPDLDPVPDVIATDSFVFVSGQSGLAAGSASSLVEQTTACLTQIEQLLQSLGLDMDRLVQVRAFLADMNLKNDVYNPVYNEFFHSRGILRKPARSTIGITLAPDELILVDAIAYV